MDRTLRAALLAAVITGGSIAFFGVFLGFDVGGTLLTAVIVAVLAALLIWGAARRAETFADAPPPPSGRSGQPGRPDPDGGTPPHPRDG